MRILQGPEHPVEAITFSPDSTTLYVVQGHHGIRAWNITDGTATRVECEGKLLIRQFVFWPGGRWAFSFTAHTTPSDQSSGRLIDLSTGAMRPFDVWGRDSISVFPDGSRFAATWGSCLSLWTMAADGPRREWQREFTSWVNNERVELVSAAALDDQLATVENVRPVTAGYHDPPLVRVTIRGTTRGERIAELAYPHPQVQQLLSSPNGDLLVARCGTELHVWDVTHRKSPPLVVPGYVPGYDADYWRPQNPSAAAFHPSGRYLLLANDDESVTAFDTSTWKATQRWAWDAGQLQACAVSPDGTLAAAGSEHGTVAVWDLDL